MHTFTTRQTLTPTILSLKNEGKKIGFVPTMGALHAGHVSLMQLAKTDADVLVVSIFVNPTQFNDPSDLAKYPRPIENDMKLLQEAGCDILYLPEVEDVYPEGPGASYAVKNAAGEIFDFGGMDKKLEGHSRPGHFAGVTQVVSILLNIVQPDNLYLGQKDFQQYLILKNMVQFLGLKLNVKRCPIIREPHGLAMSSRNVRLNEELRIKAGVIHTTLLYAASLKNILPAAEIETCCFDAINSLDDFEVDYFEMLDAQNLEAVSASTREVVFITAVITGGVRLIDNVITSF